MNDALVILSGGQDSTTCLFWAKKKYENVHALTFNYGQRHIIEIEAAKKIAELAQVNSHEIINLPNCLQSTSPLVSNTHLETYNNYKSMSDVIGDRQEITLVPMRNALFLTLAANRAQEKNITTIVTGVCQMDNANYDDCRQVFLDATEDYINKALGHDHRGTEKIKIEAPLMFLDKAESIRLANDVGAMAALGFSHTCYAGEYPPCGKCHSCVLRAQGFKDAKIDDPLIKRAKYG